MGATNKVSKTLKVYITQKLKFLQVLGTHDTNFQFFDPPPSTSGMKSFMDGPSLSSKIFILRVLGTCGTHFTEAPGHDDFVNQTYFCALQQCKEATLSNRSLMSSMYCT